MCSISAFIPGRHCEVTTARRVIASKVTGPTNRAADRVMTATTSWPRCWSPRHTSTALYAPMPPVTPSAMSAIGKSQTPNPESQLPKTPIAAARLLGLGIWVLGFGISLLLLDLLHLPPQYFALGDGDLL